jgi:Fibronectin type III domain
MSKKSKKRRGEGKLAAPPVTRWRRPRWTKVGVIVLAACLITASAATALRLGPVRRAVGLAPLIAPAAQQQANLNLSKEYVYAGGRLVATEEPTPQGGPPPTNLVATVTTVATSVGLTWAAPSSGTIANYVIERAQSKDGPFTQVGTSPQSQLSFTDTSAVADTAYLYRVKAAYSAGGASDYSNTDMATAVVFTNDPLQSGVTIIQAVHLTELRRAVDAVRLLAGLAAASWSTPAPQHGGVIQATHSLELRTNLNPALTALGLSQLSSDAGGTLAVGLPVKAVHLQDVREKVR